MKPISKAVLTAVLALAAIAPAYAFGTPKAGEFVQKASMSDLFEIEAARIALERSANPDVKAFAQTMIDDHSVSGAKLKAAAASAKADGSLATALDGKHRRIIDDLRSEDADDFDDEYADEQEDAHRKAVRLFEDYAENGDDAALKTFAANALPALKAHKEQAKTLEDRVDAAED